MNYLYCTYTKGMWRLRANVDGTEIISWSRSFTRAYTSLMGMIRSREDEDTHVTLEGEYYE